MTVAGSPWNQAGSRQVCISLFVPCSAETLAFMLSLVLFTSFWKALSIPLSMMDLSMMDDGCVDDG